MSFTSEKRSSLMGGGLVMGCNYPVIEVLYVKIEIGLR